MLCFVAFACKDRDRAGVRRGNYSCQRNRCHWRSGSDGHDGNHSRQEIAQIGKSDATPVPNTAKVVNGKEKYLIPGLWDMHVHEIFGAWLPEDEKITPVLFVANGVTGVRDMGGDLEPLKK